MHKHKNTHKKRKKVNTIVCMKEERKGMNEWQR